MSAISATTMGLAPANTLQGVLAEGAVLGGSQPDAQLAPVIPGVNAGVAGLATTSPTTQPAAVTGGGAQAVQAAGVLGEQPQLIAALQAVANAIQQLAGLLQAQAGAAMPTASSAVSGGGDTVGQCGMAGCTMDHGSPVADPALAETASQRLQAATIEPVADANAGTAPPTDASGAPAPTSVAPPSTA
jgi:hypothetical protein